MFSLKKTSITNYIRRLGIELSLIGRGCIDGFSPIKTLIELENRSRHHWPIIAPKTKPNKARIGYTKQPLYGKYLGTRFFLSNFKHVLHMKTWSILTGRIFAWPLESKTKNFDLLLSGKT